MSCGRCCSAACANLVLATASASSAGSPRACGLMSMRLPAGGGGGVSLDNNPLPLGVRLRRRAGVEVVAAAGVDVNESHFPLRLPCANREAEALGDRIPLLSSSVRDPSPDFDTVGVKRRLTGPGVPDEAPAIAPISRQTCPGHLAESRAPPT